MSWSLYELSRHPEVQASLREEVLSVLGGRSTLAAADVARMPLLKATIKEVLRYNSEGFTSQDVKFSISCLIKLLNFCFPDCTLLFLPMLESLQTETSRSEATSSLKK